MNYRLITAPDKNTIGILRRRIQGDIKQKLDNETIGAVALVQGQIPDLIYYADIAVKASDVVAVDISGNCPQKFASLAILGEVEAVNTAMQRILTDQAGNG